jgi:carboxyl-terminal processing protease
MRLRDAVTLIRGKKGTEVRLTVKRPGSKSFVISIVRDIVVIEESFVKATLIEDAQSGRRYGYIKIPSFYRDFENTNNGGDGRNSTEDTREALRGFRDQDIDGLVLDLRNNGGGALTDAIGVAGLFIKDGPVVQVRSAEGSTKVLDDEDSKVEYSGPMVILVNQFSASASEIVAGALQDYGRAVIVGSEHTHGKGTVQVVLGLDRTLTLQNMQKYLPLGALKLTTQKFYRVNGDSTQSRGVVPDIVLPDRNRSNEFGEKYLDYSLPWDSIAPVRHDNWPLSKLALSELALDSRDRVSKNEDFTEIQRISETISERLKSTRQSLHAETVYQEWEALKNENSPHGGMMAGDDPEGGRAEAAAEQESPQDKLHRLVLEDPYTREATAILGDLLKLGEPFAMHSAPSGLQ